MSLRHDHVQTQPADASQSRRRSKPQYTAETPVILPLAVVTVTALGALDVILDGDAFPPPASGMLWSRAAFGDLLNAITENRTLTVRVEVREYDGSVFTDIIRATPASRATVAPTLAAALTASPGRARHRPVAELIEISGDGFVPGEDITLAIPISTTEGSGNGTARGLLDLNQLTEPVTTVMLVGHISGRIITHQLRS